MYFHKASVYLTLLHSLKLRFCYEQLTFTCSLNIGLNRLTAT